MGRNRGVMRARVITMSIVLGALAGFGGPLGRASALAATGPRQVVGGASTPWSIVPTPAPAAQSNGALSAVACATTTNCFAVGLYDGGERGLLEQWNGSTWTIRANADPAGVHAIPYDVACGSPTFCVAVGSAGHNEYAETWDGTKWSVSATLGTHDGGLSKVSCASAQYCFALVGGTEFELYQSGSWSKVDSPPPVGDDTPSLADVSCVSSTDCTAVGTLGYDHDTAYIEHWNGNEWSVVANPVAGANPHLDGVSCTASDFCVAVGALDFGEGALIEQWNGTSWSVQAIPEAPDQYRAELSGVSCASPTDCMAVGFDAGSLTEHWDGSAWTIEPAAGDGLASVSCPQSSGCIAVGASSSNKPLSDTWNGTSWTPTSVPSPAGNSYGDLSAIKCTSTTNCFATGDNSTLPGPMVEQWNGSNWSIQKVFNYPESDYELASISCAGASNCWIVGTHYGGSEGIPLIQHWNGSRWASQQNPSIPSAYEYGFRDVACTSAKNCIAVGFNVNGNTLMSYTLAEHWSGSSWQLQPTPTSVRSGDTELWGISCPGTSSCIAVGQTSHTLLAERFDGRHWTVMPTPPLPHSAESGRLVQVRCTKSTSCFADGEYATSAHAQNPIIERWNGTTWTIQRIPSFTGSTRANLSGLACPSSTSCTAVGAVSYGNVVTPVVMRWNGNAWNTERTPTNRYGSGLAGISCPTTSTCFATGVADGQSLVLRRG